MPQDPFPNTSDPVLETRLNTVFTSLSRVEVLHENPAAPREGQIWWNKNAGTLHIFVGGKSRTLKLED